MKYPSQWIEERMMKLLENSSYEHAASDEEVSAAVAHAKINAVIEYLDLFLGKGPDEPPWRVGSISAAPEEPGPTGAPPPTAPAGANGPSFP